MNPSERNLLYAFLLIIIIGGCVLFAAHYRKKLDALSSRQEVLESQLAAFHTELDDIEKMEGFKEWLYNATSTPATDEEVDASLLERLKVKSIDQVLVSNVTLKDPAVLRDQLMSASITCKVNGPQMKALQYISSLRDYPKLILIRKLDIIRSKDGESVSATIELAKIYQSQPQR